MKFATTVAAISLLFASALEALIISSPLAGSTYGIGSPVTVLVENEDQESYGSAVVTFASPCGSWVQTIPVGTEQTLYMPCNVVGQTTVAAQSGSAQAISVQIAISPAYNNYNYNNACGYGYGNACGPIACAPRASCHRRSRRGCGYYAEEASSVSEFNPQDFEFEQQQQEEEQQQEQN